MTILVELTKEFLDNFASVMFLRKQLRELDAMREDPTLNIRNIPIDYAYPTIQKRLYEEEHKFIDWIAKELVNNPLHPTMFEDLAKVKTKT